MVRSLQRHHGVFEAETRLWYLVHDYAESDACTDDDVGCVTYLFRFMS